MKIINAALFPLALTIAACTNSATSPGTTDEFRDCESCPLMRELPPGRFLMGTAPEDRLIDPRTGKPATNDGPQHTVTINYTFAIGVYEVTVGEFRRFIDATGYPTVDRCMEFSKPDSFEIRTDVDWDAPGYTQTDSMPVGCVSYFDALAYTDWLSELTGQPYRLPTESEWEYAARAGTTTPYYWGTDEAAACDFANIRSPGAETISDRQAQSDIDDGFPCDDGYPGVSPAGKFKPNAFGLFDIQGNNWEWVADCNHKNYDGAPSDGSAWADESDCRFGLIRGGSYLNRVERSSATVRVGRPRTGAATNMGFRVALGAAQKVDAAAPVYEATTDASPGALLFADNCAACHQSPTGFEGLYGKDQAALVKLIRDGGNNIMSMPAFGTVLADRQIEQLASYLRDINDWP